MKKVTVNGTVTSHERYLYRGYLQIAALDMLNSRNVLRTLLWDPLEPVATRPLALVRDNALYCYGIDFNKNVTEVFDAQGTIAAAYDYSPYGTVTGTGSLVQPVQWSSEMNDAELSLVYYNYRYYNPVDGRWINRDPIAEEGGWNLYGFVWNRINIEMDLLGFKTVLINESEQLEKEKYIKFLVGVKGKASCDNFGRTSKLEEMETNITIEYENYVDKKIIKTDVLMNLDTHFKARVYVQANGFTSSAHHMTHAGSSMCAASIPCVFKFPALGAILCAGGIILIAIPHICDMTWNIEGSYLIEVKSDGCVWDGAGCYPKLDKKIEKEN